MCAWVLGRHQQYQTAEDAILRNLDVDLETPQSTVALVSLYYHSGNCDRLAAMLSRDEVVKLVPVPGLLLSAGLIGGEALPDAATDRLTRTLYAYRDERFGPHQIALRGTHDWKLADAELNLSAGGQRLIESRARAGREAMILRFATEDSDDGNARPRVTRDPLVLTLNYPDAPDIRIHLGSCSAARSGEDNLFAEFSARAGAVLGINDPQRTVFRITAVEVGDQRLSLMEPSKMDPASS